MYRVRLEKKVFGNPGAEFSVTLHLQVALPFPPTPGVNLGLLEASTFCSDECLVRRVHYNVPRAEFHVELENNRYPDPFESAAWHIKHGWRMPLEFPSETPEGADESEPGLYYIVEAIGMFYSVTKAELWCLDAQGTPYRLVKRPEAAAKEVD